MHRRGTFTTGGQVRQRYQCNICRRSFTAASIHNTTEVGSQVDDTTSVFVVTSCQNNTNTNSKFLNTLISYCNHNQAKLLVIPTLYRATMEKTEEISWDVPSHLICWHNIELKHIRIYGDLKIIPTAENPLAGLDPLSKGKTVIVGHNQLQMRSLPVSINENPVILHTTGTVSIPNYTISKQGEKANFNHSFSALVIEVDHKNDIFHIRVLNSDESGGFYDLDRQYRPSGQIVTDCRIDALVTGDEHAVFMDPDVKRAIYMNTDSLVNTLKPSVIVRHDVVDSYSITHHDKHNFINRYKKRRDQLDNLEQELHSTEQLLVDTTPDFAVNWIVSSNHNDHLTKWLNTADPKEDVQNAKIYHWLMWQILDRIDNQLHSQTPFELWLRRNPSSIAQKTKFLSRLESANINGVDVSLHGDVASGGARGSALSFSKLPQKTITGHSHSPFIQQGAYGVGCSCIKDLSYVNGPGSWMHTSCVIHKNGKRQLITIVRGQWRLIK